MNEYTKLIAAWCGILLLSVRVSAIAAPPAPDAGAVLRQQQPSPLTVPRTESPSLDFEKSTEQPKSASNFQFALQRIILTGNYRIPSSELAAIVKDALGHKVGLTELEEIAARVSRLYHARGFIVARAYLPPQEIKDGVVEIAIVEGRYGKLELLNHARLDEAVAKRYLAPLRFTWVYGPKIERRLLLLNDLAGVDSAHASLSPGDFVGESAASFELTATPLVRSSIEYDNHGNHFIGANRLTGRFDLLSPLRLGDELKTRFTHGFDGLDYGYFDYRVPIGNNGWRIGIDYGASAYHLGKHFAPLAASGDSESTSVELSHPVIRTRTLNFYAEASYGWHGFQDRVDATNTISDKRTRNLGLTVSGDLRDSLLDGGISVFSILYNNGQVDIDSASARTIDSVSARTHGHFDKWNFNLLRLQQLGTRTSLLMSLSAQQAGKNLDSSEKFILGGANGVRAYPQGEASGDSGYLFTTELRHRATPPWGEGSLQPFSFVDVGAVTLNDHPFTSGTNRRHLAGVGVGVSWFAAHDIELDLTLAARVAREHATSDTDSHVRGWIQFIKRF